MGVTHATIIALISKRVLNDALPRINFMTILRKKKKGKEDLYMYTERGKVGYTGLKCKIDIIV